MSRRSLLTVLSLILLCGSIAYALSGFGWADEDVGTEGVRTTAEPAPVSPDPSETIFRSDFHNAPPGAWKDVQEVGETASVTFQDVVDEDISIERYGRFELHEGDERAEVYHDLELVEGDDLYLRFLARLSEGFPAEDTWQLIWQLHQDGDDGSPPLALAIEGSDPGRFILEGADPADVYWEGPEIDTGRWHAFVLRVNHSPDDDTGFVEVWHDGVQQLLTNGEYRLHTSTMLDESNYPKVGYYRNPEMSGTGMVDIGAYAIWHASHEE